MPPQDPTIFPCGRGFFPGTQGPGGGGQEPTTTTVIIVPSNPKPPDPPFTPAIPKPPQNPGNPGSGSPGTGDPITTDPVFSVPQAPPIRPRPRPGGGGTGGGQSGFHKCEVVALGVCPGEEGLPLNEATITTVFTECRPCSPNFVNANGSVETDPNCTFSSLALCQANCASPTFTNLPCPPEISTQEPDPLPGPITPGGSTTEPTLGTSVGDVISTPEPTQTAAFTVGVTTTPLGDPIVRVPIPGSNLPGEPTVVIPGRPQVLEPESPSLSVGVTNESNRITENQQATNGNVISVNQLVDDEDFRDTQAGISKPVLFDPNLNFFETTPNEDIELVFNNSHLTVLNTEVASEIAELLSISNSNMPWNEVTLQNISDDKLIASLNPLLLNSFQYLRYPGGNLIGVTTLLNVVRKHLLQGTLDEFDPEYYITAAQSQLDQSFDVLEKPESQELADRLAIEYLKNNLHQYQNNKRSNWRNFQINRVRPLNDDVKITLEIRTVDGDSKDISIPNDGFALDRLTDLTQITSPILGSTDKLNIGDGGGYYVQGLGTGGEGIPIYTDNIIPDAYYAPASVRLKVLNMLDVDSDIKITASSNSGQHEFVAGDAGASATTPLFFALNVTSVSGEYTDNPLVESYSGTYSRLVDKASIDRYVNNHALSIPMMALDYRDPLYRYILDTSSFTASLKDFNLISFEDQGFSSIGSRFVKNIPFGFVVTPVAGGKYNPFNGGSTLDKTGDIHVRSLSMLPVTDESIDGNQPPILEAFSLNLVSGIDRVGVGELEDTQNIGYRYNEEDFTETFYSLSSGEYGASASPLSAQGTAYMLREVIDTLSSTYSATTFTWYDVFSRMPVTRLGEMFYDTNKDFILEIGNGFRGGITLNNIESGYKTNTRIIAEDDQTIVTVADRTGVTTVKR